jgi:hypothetical protein
VLGAARQLDRQRPPVRDGQSVTNDGGCAAPAAVLFPLGAVVESKVRIWRDQRQMAHVVYHISLYRPHTVATMSVRVQGHSHSRSVDWMCVRHGRGSTRPRARR